MKIIKLSGKCGERGRNGFCDEEEFGERSGASLAKQCIVYTLVTRFGNNI